MFFVTKPGFVVLSPNPDLWCFLSYPCLWCFSQTRVFGVFFSDRVFLVFSQTRVCGDFRHRVGGCGGFRHRVGGCGLGCGDGGGFFVVSAVVTGGGFVILCLLSEPDASFLHFFDILTFPCFHDFPVISVLS